MSLTQVPTAWQGNDERKLGSDEKWKNRVHENGQYADGKPRQGGRFLFFPQKQEKTFSYSCKEWAPQRRVPGGADVKQRVTRKSDPDGEHMSGVLQSLG